MRLVGSDESEIVIALNGSITFRLRASLRAATRLLSKYESPAHLIALIQAGGLTATLDVIRECSDNSRVLAIVTTRVSEKGLAETLWPQRDNLIAFVLRLYGASNNADSPADPGKPMTHAEFIERLFAIGTGWLQWSPTETWNASIAEILTARDALLEKLKAIHGSGERVENIDGKGGLDPDVAAELNALGDMSVTSTMNVGAV